MLFDDPPLTPREEAELADIPPYAREAFYRTVKFRWYANAAVGTLVGWSIEYAAFGVDFGWLYMLPMLVMALVIHRKKWNRTTDLGALSKAKLAMRPDWPSWKRDREYWDELAEIRAQNPGRDSNDPDELRRDHRRREEADCPMPERDMTEI